MPIVTKGIATTSNYRGWEAKRVRARSRTNGIWRRKPSKKEKKVQRYRDRE